MATEPLTDALRETLALFDGDGAPLTTSEVAERLDLGHRSSYARLDRLVEHGRLETKKVGASARVWWRPTANAEMGTPDWSAASESLIDDVLDDADVGVFVLDDDYRVRWINDATERYFGLDRERVVGHDKRALVDERIAATVEDSETFSETVLATYDDNTYTERFECRVTSGDGREERWLEHRSKPIDAGAYAGGRVELYYEVTDRKQTERSLERSKEGYSNLVGNLPGMVYRCQNEPKWPMEFVSDACTDLTGYDADDVESGAVDWGDDVVHPDDRGRVWEAVQSDLDRGEEFALQYRIETAEGETRWVWERGHIVADASGPPALEGVVTDITPQKMAERELRESELEDVVERMDDGFFALDDDLRFTYVNERASDLLERLPGELVGEHVGDAFELDERTEAAITEAMETQEPGTYEEFYEPLDTWFEAHIYPSETGVSVYFKDVTERRRNERKLEQYERIVETVDDGIYVLDGDRRFTMVNNGFASMTGYERDDLIGARADAVFGDDFLDVEEEVWNEPEDDEHAVEKLREDIQTADGKPLTVESRFTVFELEDGDAGRVGVVRDVTDHVEYERELERSERRYRALVDNFPNGIVVLFDEDLRYLTAGGTVFESLDFSAADMEGDTMDERLPPELRDELEPKFGAVFDGETSEFELEFDGRVRRVSAFPVYDDHGNVFAGMAMSQDVTERIERERELERQREHLTALDHINDVVRDINEAAIEQSTREDIEASICERLADTDSYLFAWIGEIDRHSETVNVRTEAGTDGYLDGTSLSVTSDGEHDGGPTARAIERREMQTAHDVPGEDGDRPWSDHVRGADVRASAAIPIVHEESLYGVLNVYSDRPDAFTAEECQVVGQLGEIAGHAIAAVERKRALMNDEVVELEFHLDDAFETLGIDATSDGRITLDQAVPARDGTYLVYGTVTADARASLDALTERFDHWDSMQIVDEEEDGVRRFELRLTEPPILSAIASRGGYVDAARIDQGDFHLRIHLSPSVDVRSVTDVVREEFPTIELLAHRQVSRTDDSTPQLRQLFREELTDRQRTALEAAYNAGFFEWPRTTSGEDVAESLGISPPTFHQHLRKAERKTLEAILRR
jgi:PAS domain S-box-containing protein